MRGAVLLTVLAMATAPASVSVADEPLPRVDVVVGKTVEKPVGIAIGWFCDDPALVKAEVVTRNDANVWIVTGVKAGTTQCRVGTDPTRPYYVFDVHVVTPKPKR